MPATNTSRAYGTVHRFLHWTIAVLILSAIALGLYAESFRAGGAATLARMVEVFSIHKTVGIAVLFLALVRIAWVLVQGHPRPLHPQRQLETLVASTVHWALYGGMVLMPLAGWLLHSAAPGGGFADILWPFGQRLPGVPQDAALSERFTAFHVNGWWLLAALVALHIGGALKHTIIDRDATLARMAGNAALVPEPPRHPQRHRWLPPLLALALWGGLATWAATVERAPEAPPEQAAQQAPASVAPAETAASAWTVQSGTLGLSVTQAGVPVEGQFGTWTATIAYDETTGTGEVAAEVNIASLTLGAVSGMATGPDFLNAAAFPTARFEGQIARTTEGGTAHQATGTLTVAGQAQPATLPFDLTIEGDRATARVTLTLDRRDFGVGATYADESTVAFPVVVTIDLTATRG